MISFIETTKRYGRAGAAPPAVAAVSLDIAVGSVCAVVGPNGAGKSTLLSLLLGFIRPTSGAVTLAGEKPRDYVAAHGAGYLPERFTLPDTWRTRDALRLFAHLDAADPTVHSLGLAEHLDKPVGSLSRGLLQRVGIAQAIAAARPLIVLDEPTEGLDPVWRLRLRDIVRDLRDRGSTLILASHDLAEIEHVADRAILLDRGAVREDIDLTTTRDAARYRIRLAEPFAAIDTAFPGATTIDEHTFEAAVASAAELTGRVAALIELGAVIAAVEPVRDNLEQRVRSALAEDA